jgi:hypothetical protein
MDVGLGEGDRIDLLSVVTIGMSFGSFGGAGAGVACQPPGDLFVSDVGPPSAWKVLWRCRAGHRSAQVTDQRHCEPERFPTKEFEDRKQLILTMVDRPWRGKTSKEITQDQLVNAMTVIWFFASIDRNRMNILSNITIMRRLLEQNI